MKSGRPKINRERQAIKERLIKYSEGVGVAHYFLEKTNRKIRVLETEYRAFDRNTGSAHAEKLN